jgi:hypothetical protein
MELYIWFFITLSANILILNFSCFFKQLPPFPFRFNFCNTPLLQEVQAPGFNFIWKKQFSMFFSLPRLYLTLTKIKTSEFWTLGRYFLKRVRFRIVTNHLKRRHYRVCSPAFLALRHKIIETTAQLPEVEFGGKYVIRANNQH